MSPCPFLTTITITPRAPPKSFKFFSKWQQVSSIILDPFKYFRRIFSILPQISSSLVAYKPFDGSINRRFLAQEVSVKKSGSSHVVYRKWYRQMSKWDRGSLSVEVSVYRCEFWVRLSLWPLWSSSPQWPPVEYISRTRICAKWVLEDNITLYGQEKSDSLYLSLSVRLSLSHNFACWAPFLEK